MKKITKRSIIFIVSALLLVQMLPMTALAAKWSFAGDVLMDGEIDASDARFVLRMSVGLESYTYAQKRLADINTDDEIGSDDARFILRASVGLENATARLLFLSDSELSEYAYKTEQPTEEPTTDEPTTDEPTTDEPTTDEPTTDEPTTDEPTTDEPTTDEPEPGRPVIPEKPSYPMPEPSSVSGTFTFTAYGWGHGVGMSQYGAVGMADDGFTCDEILRHYYSGIKIIRDDSYPETTEYLGETYNTEKLLALMVCQEIYGIVDEEPGRGIEALKAQTIAIFTLLEYYDFNVRTKYSVGVAADRSYSSLPTVLKDTVSSVIGLYMVKEDDPSLRPVEAVYGAMAAGASASSKDVWGNECSYLQAVSSPYEMRLNNFTCTFTFSAERMYDIITDYSWNIELSDDPADWIEIVEHSGSIDSERGYVTKIRVGNRVLDGYAQFCDGMMADYFWSTRYFCSSSCFYVTYTP